VVHSWYVQLSVFPILWRLSVWWALLCADFVAGCVIVDSCLLGVVFMVNDCS
jgi:hypothetical protein